MQAVQLEMLRGEDPTNPKDWTAFIVSGDGTLMVFPEGQEPRTIEDEPIQTDGRGGRATKPLGHSASASSMLVKLLGFMAMRRRGR